MGAVLHSVATSVFNFGGWLFYYEEYDGTHNLCVDCKTIILCKSPLLASELLSKNIAEHSMKMMWQKVDLIAHGKHLAGEYICGEAVSWQENGKIQPCELWPEQNNH